MVVAIIAIAAALAVPNLLPEVQKAQVDGAAEIVAATAARARTEAMISKRCVRMWIDSTNARRIVVERLNTFDCDVAPATFPAGFASKGIDGTAAVWSPITAQFVDAAGVTLTLSDPPQDTGACTTENGGVSGTPAGFNCVDVIFRPNGRTWTQNVDQNDDAVITVSHSGLTATKQVLINSNGLICIYRLGKPLLAGAGAGDFVCPP